MGIILSRFRKKKTTIEILEDLDSQIKEIQQYGQTTEQRHKKIVGTIIIYGVVLYVMTALIFYFYFFPASLYYQLFYIIPLLLFPILLLLTKKMISCYYNRKITHNQEKLSTIIGEKKKILNEVTETETYKKAKEILLKFAPDELNMSPLTPKFAPELLTSETPRRPISQIAANPLPVSGDLRRRVLSTQNQSQSRQTGASGTATPTGGPLKQLSNTPYQFNSRVISPVPSIGFRSPLPRPVLSQQRTVIDRLVDYLVGDGPSNRYALICRQCESHNGMALKEEFEYFAYRCCYCGFWNPARKQKPYAPKLDADNSSFIATSNMSELLSCNIEEDSVKHIESETQSDTDTERSGASKKSEDEELETLLHEDSCLTVAELEESEGDDDATVSKRLTLSGMIQKQGHCVLFRHRSSRKVRRNT